MTNNKPENPAPAGSPQPEYNQPPVPPQTPYEQQPVNQQYFAQPQAAPVQYAVVAKSLKGVGGWLLFWVIVFALSAVGYITAFFRGLDGGQNNDLVTVLFSPVLTGLAIASVTLIVMQKKLGRYISIAFIGASTLYGIIHAIANRTALDSTADIVGQIAGSILGGGLLAAYFIASRRVKETLVN